MHNTAMFGQPACLAVLRSPSRPLSPRPVVPRQANPPPSRRYQHDPLPTSSWTASSRTSMDKAGLSKPLRRTSASSWQTRPTLRSRRSKTLPQRADRPASRHRAGTSARRWTASTSSSSRPVTTSRSAALRRQAGRPVTAARRRPTSRRRPRRIIRPDSVADIEDSEARQQGRGERRPASCMADIEDSEARQRGRGERRPGSMADIEDSEARHRG